MNRFMAEACVVAFLVCSARAASAESLDDRAPPGGRPSTRPGQGSLERAREYSPEEEAQLLEDARRIVLSADLVIEGEAERLLTPSPRADFFVNRSLKGAATSEVLTIDLAKAPVGLWPREGERKILCLAPDGAGGYELAAYHASILPSTEGAREAIAALLGIPYAEPAGLEVVEGVVPDEAEAAAEAGAAEPPGPYAEDVAGAETILVGLLTNVERVGEAAEGVFRLDEKEGALLGYDGFGSPITVQFALGEERTDPPEAGRYCLFLKGSTAGPGFDSIHEITLADAEAEGDLRREIARAIVGREGRLTTIQATLAEWQSAWNSKDLDRCIKCYSVANAARKLYKAGGRAREDLAQQIADFASTVTASVQRVDPARHAPQEAGTGRVEVEAAVLIELTVLGMQDRRTTKMKFVQEKGELLILDEGL